MFDTMFIARFDFFRAAFAGILYLSAFDEPCCYLPSYFVFVTLIFDKYYDIQRRCFLWYVIRRVAQALEKQLPGNPYVVVRLI